MTSPDRYDFAFGGLSAIAVSSSILVAYAATRPTQLLEWWPLLFLGSVSYGLYLWHRTALDLTVALPVAIGLTLSLALAFASYHLIERPFLRLKRAQDNRRYNARGVPSQWDTPRVRG